MTPEEQQKKTELEQKINEEFSQLQQNLWDLKSDIQTETDENKKQEKNKKVQEIESEVSDIKVWKERLERMTSLQEQELLSLKERIESLKSTIQNIRWEVADLQNEKSPTPTTYELLKNSETYKKLLEAIESNPEKFKNLEKDDEWNTLDTAEKKLEYMFKKIRNSIVLFMKNKLWDSENTEKVINNTIAPAFERSLMELLRDQWNEWNTSMLQWISNISRDSFSKLIDWVSDFATKTRWSYNKFSQWINAVDYLSVHNLVLRKPNKSEVLSNPIKFKEYMNNDRFAADDFSPYTTISDNIFMIDENQTFEFGMSLQEKQSVLTQIWNIQHADNPKTAALIAKLVDKPEKFLWATAWLQETANHLLDWAEVISSITAPLWIDILWEITKAPEERSFIYKIVDFVCKLIWITWWLEWIVKKWRLDKMKLTDEKNENISQIFDKYKKSAWQNQSISVTDEDSCKAALNDFSVTEDWTSTTKWDYLRDSIADNINLSLISPDVVKQIFENSYEYYLKTETITKDWETKEITTVDASKFSENDKKELAHRHLINMKTHLEKYNENDLSDFYTNINSTEDLAICITTALYADKNDVIEWVKAKVFLPENYGTTTATTVESTSTWWWSNEWNDRWRENLDSTESSDKQVVNEAWVYDKAKEYWITDNRQIAYVLSTIKWESWFKNQKEIWWENKSYWKVDSSTWKAYYGRWFIQLTHKGNYQAYTQIIKDSWKDFKDNNWNTIKWSDIDLVQNPDIILESNELSIFIAMDRMKNWWPNRQNNRKLDYYINDNKQDYYNARIIVNWMSSNPKWYEDTAKEYLSKLWNGSEEDSQQA